jgi:hypothetical protein
MDDYLNQEMSGMLTIINFLIIIYRWIWRWRRHGRSWWWRVLEWKIDDVRSLWIRWGNRRRSGHRKHQV